LRLLVVDDNQDAANSLAMLLGLQGHEVRVAYSGMAALEMTKTYTPDVVLMDIGMPGADGYAFIGEVRRREADSGGRLPAVALTAYAGVEARQRAISAGFQTHLAKPLDPAEMVAAVAKLAGRGL
jgi:CheY-like chemotaxis protein